MFSNSVPSFRNKYKDLLHRAASKGLVNTVKSLISVGEDVNAKDQNECTPLHYAIENNKPEIVKILTEVEGIKLNEENDEGYTPLQQAIHKADVDIVNILLKTNRVDLSVMYDGENLLLFAANYSEPEIVELLLNQDYFDINEKDESGDTILHRIFYPENGPGDGPTAWTDTILLLINTNKIDLNARNLDGDTPFHLAVSSGITEIVTAFMSVWLKFDINTRDNSGMTPLHTAAANGDVEIVEILVKYGADANIANKRGELPLYFAIKNKNYQLASILVNITSDLNIKDNDGQTLLHYAIEYQVDEIIELLLSGGANLSIVYNKY